MRYLASKVSWKLGSNLPFTHPVWCQTGCHENVLLPLGSDFWLNENIEQHKLFSNVRLSVQLIILDSLFLFVCPACWLWMEIHGVTSQTCVTWCFGCAMHEALPRQSTFYTFKSFFIRVELLNWGENFHVTCTWSSWLILPACNAYKNRLFCSKFCLDN